MQNVKGVVGLYCCGGAGAQVGGPLLQVKSSPGYADMISTFIDTSAADLSLAGISDSKSMFIITNNGAGDEIDGAGGLRREIAAVVNDNIQQILLKHPPQRTNIVVYSASGGSGSTIGPLLHAELVRQGKTVISFIIGSEESVIRGTNTIGTLKTCHNLGANVLKKPFLFNYTHNIPGAPWGEVNTLMRDKIAGMCYLFSREHAKIDTSDIANWADYTRVSTVAPGLALVSICTSAKEVQACAEKSPPITIASVYASKEPGSLGVVADYDTIGFQIVPGLTVPDMHYVVTTDAIDSIAKNIQDSLSKMSAVSNARSKQNSLVKSDDTADASGLIF